MKRKAMFCCDASRDMYEEYYTNQTGNGMPVFVGGRHQRGHGLGSVLGRLFRHIILPFFKSNGQMMASKAIKTGLRVADDVAQGTSFKESAKRRIPDGIKATARKLNWQTGSRAPKSKRPGPRSRAPPRHRRYKDIFG